MHAADYCIVVAEDDEVLRYCTARLLRDHGDFGILMWALPQFWCRATEPGQEVDGQPGHRAERGLGGAGNRHVRTFRA